ncbi:MAG TPA: hypothetical protein VLT62_20605 [Candidatus Methylomirabilis sp.]|nr:hypothetical protein [Candidatus Methylomirabilis sp.]
MRAPRRSAWCRAHPENGRIVMSGKGADLLTDPNIRLAYLGG